MKKYLYRFLVKHHDAIQYTPFYKTIMNLVGTLNRMETETNPEKPKVPEAKGNPQGSPSNAQPQKPSLNQPKPKEKNPERTKKIIIRTIIALVIGSLLALFLFFAFYGGPPIFRVRTVEALNDTTFVLVSDTGERRQVSNNQNVSLAYYGSTDRIQVVVGSGLSSYFFVLALINNPDPATNLGLIAAQVGNARINLSSGQVALVGNDGVATPNGSLSSSLGTLTQGAHSRATVPANGPNILSIIVSILPLLLYVFIIYFLYRSFKGSQGAQGGESVFSIGKSQAKLANSNVKFSDVAGIEEEKSELIEIVDYLKRPERYAAMGARSPKGVVLYGPPGTGKTLLAKAVAGEAEVPFFQVSGSAFEDMLVGVGAKRVRDLFNKAVKAAPAIIFIDEIDSVGSKRGKFETTGGSLADQTLNQLLAEMDGFNARSGVVVIAATNRLDVLDDALLRPGRFDRHIQVNLPDIKERTAILKIHAKNKNLSSSVDLEDISRRTPGFSGAQLENVLNEATLLAVRKNKTAISTDDLDEAIDRVIAGPAKKSRVISTDEKRQIAYHEAGHALVGLHSKSGDVVQKITIIPRGQAAGYTLSVPEFQELSIQKKSDLLNLVCSALGGRAAEEFIYGKDSISTGAANDLFKVTNIVKAMVTQLGMSNVGMTQFIPSEGSSSPYAAKFFSESTSQAIDKEIESIIKEQYQNAMKILKENKKELDLIVESLLILETIVKPQIDFIHKHKELPKEALEKKKELEEKKKHKEHEKDHTKPQNEKKDHNNVTDAETKKNDSQNTKINPVEEKKPEPKKVEVKKTPTKTK